MPLISPVAVLLNAKTLLTMLIVPLEKLPALLKVVLESLAAPSKVNVPLSIKEALSALLKLL